MSESEGMEARPGTSILLHDADHRLELRPIRTRDRLMANLFAKNLDSELAAGAPVDAHHLRAVRSAVLVAPAQRRKLADSWETLVDRARPDQQPSVLSSRVPVQREHVLSAADRIDDLTRALRSARPVSARGVAMARVLLTDAASPVYSRRTRRDLAELVSVAAAELDSSDLSLEP